MFVLDAASSLDHASTNNLVCGVVESWSVQTAALTRLNWCSKVYFTEALPIVTSIIPQTLFKIEIKSYNLTSTTDRGLLLCLGICKNSTWMGMNGLSFPVKSASRKWLDYEGFMSRVLLVWLDTRRSLSCICRKAEKKKEARSVSDRESQPKHVPKSHRIE